MRDFVKDFGRLREKYHGRGVLEVNFDGFLQSTEEQKFRGNIYTYITPTKGARHRPSGFGRGACFISEVHGG